MRNTYFNTHWYSAFYSAIHRLIHLIILLHFINAEVLQPNNSSGFFENPNQTYRASWITDIENDVITFTIQAETTGWIALGFSIEPSGHDTTDSIVVWVSNNDTAILLDNLSNVRSQPIVDISQDVTLLTSSEVEGMTTATFTRSLTSTNDIDNDANLLAAPMTLVWAYGTDDGVMTVNGPTYSQHEERGISLNVNFADNTIQEITPAPGAIIPIPNPTGCEEFGDGVYTLTWVADPQANTLLVEMRAFTAGWIGVGFSNNAGGHSGTDSVVGWVNDDGTLTLIDNLSNSRQQPILDDEQNVIPIAFSQNDTETIIQFTRPLVSIDTDNDVMIVNAPMSVSWSYGDLDGDPISLTYDQHTESGRNDALNLISPNDIVAIPDGVIAADNDNWIAMYSVNIAQNTIDITLMVRTLGWVAFGISNTASGHNQTDSFVAWVDDDDVETQANVRLFDQFSIAQGQPPLDITQNPIGRGDDWILLSGTQNNEALLTTIMVRRSLQTRDELNDVDIINSIQSVSWAYAEDDGTVDDETGLPTYTQHVARGVLPFNFVVNATEPERGLFVSPNNDYRIMWSVDLMQQIIQFELEVDTVGWVAVGVSNTGSGHNQTDSIVVWIPENLTENALIFDGFSSSQGQPITDAQSNSVLTSAIERDGVTRVHFNRPLVNVDTNVNVNIESGVMTLVWAYGLIDGTLLDSNTPLYTQHAVRGAAQVDILANQQINDIVLREQTQGSFTSPDGVYQVSWTVSPTGDEIQFDMSADVNGWIGVAWSSNNGGHSSTDSVVGWINDDGETTLIDGFSVQQSIPIADEQQDVLLIASSQTDSSTSISFSRPLVTPDDGNEDIDIIDEDQFLSWAYGNADGEDNNNYPQHTVRGTTAVNFLAGVVNDDGENYLIPDAGYGVTAIVVIILGLFSLIHLSNWACKGCAERRRRKKIINNALGVGFDVYEDPGLDLAATDIQNTELNSFANSTAVASGGLQSTPVQETSFQFQQKLYDQSNEANITPTEANEFEPSNYNPNGTYFQGSQQLKVEETTEEVDRRPVQIIVSSKSTSNVVSSIIQRILRKRIPFSQVRMKEGIIFLLYALMNIGWVYRWPVVQTNTAINVGFVAAANSLWVAVPATRNSAVKWLLGVPFERALTYHRWLGRWLFIVATAHGLYYAIPNINATWTITKNMNGFIAWACLLFIQLTSLSIIRRKLFNVFIYSHAIFIAYYIFLARHSIPSRWYIYVALIIYAIDRVLRLVRNASLFPQRALQTIALPGGLVRLRFRKRGIFKTKWKAGQYVFINFPGIAPFQWHPFSLTSGPHEEFGEVHIKALGNHTRRFTKLIQNSMGVLSPLLRVEGPYGRLQFRYKRYSQLVLVGGGVGVTPLVSILREVYQLKLPRRVIATHPRSTWLKHVYVVWTLPTETEWSWFADTLAQAKILAIQHLNKTNEVDEEPYPAITVIGHISQQGTTSDTSLLIGRPNIKDVFSRIHDDIHTMTESSASSVRVAVYACGPKPMVNKVWDETRRLTRGRSRFDFHHEIFEF